MMPGRVLEQPVRCGKASCRCAAGNPHRAHYRYWTEGGRQRKEYVRRGDLEATRAACDRWAEADAIKAAILGSAGAAAVRAEARATLREALGEQIHTASGRRALRRLR